MLPQRLLLCFVWVVFAACQAGGGLDDDSVTPAGDDDDDDDDDDDTVADDDTTPIPDGIPMGGTLSWQPNQGTPPAGTIRAGLFRVRFGEFVGEERWGAEVTQGALVGGDNVFIVYVDEAPPAGDLETSKGVGYAMYVPFVYVDVDASGLWNAGEAILGSTDRWLAWVEAEDGLPAWLVLAGAGPGWNLVTGVIEEDMEFDPVPDGATASTGLEIPTRGLPVESGVVPLDSDVLFPESGSVAAFHSGLFEGVPPAVPELFTTGVEGEGLPGPALVDWEISGPPPLDHLIPLGGGEGDDDSAGGDGPGFSVLGASYLILGYSDDGNGHFGDTCDALVAYVPPESTALIWMEPAWDDLLAAYYLAVIAQTRPGWAIQEGEFRRLLAVGAELLPPPPPGDDDSAGPQWPMGCGDDDDSAGDDDSSAP